MPIPLFLPGEKQFPLKLLGNYPTVSLIKTGPHTIKAELPYDPAISLPGIYPDKTIIQKDTCTPMFIAALFTIAKTWKQPKRPSTDEWIKKVWYIHTMEYYSAIKRKEIIPFATTWMQLEIITLNEVRKRKTNTIWYHLYVESKIWHKWTYLWNRIRDIENRLVVAKGEGGGRGLDWEVVVSRCKLAHIEWINNKVLL